MNKIRLSLNVAAFALFFLALSSVAQAQATRTWVSGVGDDANPCSRTAPCKTFAGAISKTADGGEINAIDSGGFGAVTITKGITIDGAGVHASILACSTNGVIVNESTNTKTIALRNLSINGCSGTASPGINGIRYLAGKTLHVEKTVIFGFSTSGIDVNKTANGELSVHDVEIRNTGTFGIDVDTSAGTVTVSINNLNVRDCTTGVHLGNGSKASLRNSVITHCTNDALTADEALASPDCDVTLENCLLALSENGIQAGGGTPRIRLSNTTITQNNTSMQLIGGTVDTAGNNRIFGNNTNTNPNGTLTPPV